jgi:hypothetical protein
VVKSRTPLDKGGDPSNAGKSPDWTLFKLDATGSAGAITAGLTNEVAHSGAQSLYVDFNHVSSPQSLVLVSNFIPVASGTDYQFAMWGRTDDKDLINSEGRSAYLKIEVDYFAKDANESVGDPFYKVQPLPGSKDHDPFFRPDGWSCFTAVSTTPPDAVFAQVTWRWETGTDPGEINGIMYFDDATMAGPPAPNPAMTPFPVEMPNPDASPTPAASPAASPSASPRPAGQ